MNLTEAINRVLADYPEFTENGLRIADLDRKTYQPSPELVTIGSVIYSYLDNGAFKEILFKNAMEQTGYYSAELNIEGNHQLLIRAVWEQIVWCLEDQINQVLHELEDDEATRQGL